MYLEGGYLFWRAFVLIAAVAAVVTLILKILGFFPTYPFQLPVP
jgi:hypothetical protein